MIIGPAVQSQSGFTLIEIIIASLIIAAFLVPAMQALDTITHSGSELQQQAERERFIEARINTVLALPFELLAENADGNTTPSAYSDPTTADPRILVFISKFDGDATGSPVTFFDIHNVDPELLWMRVAYADTNDGLTTLVYNQ